MSTLPTGAGICPSQRNRESSIIESHAQAIAGRLRQLDNQLKRIGDALDKFSGNDHPEVSCEAKASPGCASSLLTDNEAEIQRLLDRSETLANAIEEVI